MIEKIKKYLNFDKVEERAKHLEKVRVRQVYEINELNNDLDKVKKELQEVKKFNARKVYEYLGKYPGPSKTKIHQYNYELINKIIHDQVEMRMGSNYQRFKTCEKNLFKSYTENEELEEKYEKLSEDYKNIKIKYLELLERFNRND